MRRVLIQLISLLIAGSAIAQMYRPDIPHAWDDRGVAGFELPLAQPDRSPKYPSAAEHYALEVRPIYRGYPVCAPVRNPPGTWRR